MLGGWKRPLLPLAEPSAKNSLQLRGEGEEVAEAAVFGAEAGEAGLPVGFALQTAEGGAGVDEEFYGFGVGGVVFRGDSFFGEALEDGEGVGGMGLLPLVREGEPESVGATARLRLLPGGFDVSFPEEDLDERGAVRAAQPRGALGGF